MAGEAAARNYEFMDEEARRRHEEELQEKLEQYVEERRVQRQNDDQELEDLKERQAQRKLERAQEMEEMAERMREAEIRKKADEEEKKALIEEERQLRLERKRKTGGTSIYDVFGRGGGPKEAAKTNSDEEKAAIKKEFLESIQSMGVDDLREKVKELHARSAKLEAERYDLEQRQKTQEYDLKELKDRQSQIARHKAASMGLDAEAAAKSKYPPKVITVTKYDRQIDRRDFGERKGLYNKPATQRVFKLYHGSAKPPPEWKPKEYEEVENIRKVFDGFKYLEAEPVEGAKPPVPVIPKQEIPEKDAFEEVPVQNPELPAPE